MNTLVAIVIAVVAIVVILLLAILWAAKRIAREVARALTAVETIRRHTDALRGLAVTNAVADELLEGIRSIRQRTQALAGALTQHDREEAKR